MYTVVQSVVALGRNTKACHKSEKSIFSTSVVARLKQCDRCLTWWQRRTWRRVATTVHPPRPPHSPLASLAPASLNPAAMGVRWMLLAMVVAVAVGDFSKKSHHTEEHRLSTRRYLYHSPQPSALLLLARLYKSKPCGKAKHAKGYKALASDQPQKVSKLKEKLDKHLYQQEGAATAPGPSKDQRIKHMLALLKALQRDREPGPHHYSDALKEHLLKPSKFYHLAMTFPAATLSGPREHHDGDEVNQQGKKVTSRQERSVERRRRGEDTLLGPSRTPLRLPYASSSLPAIFVSSFDGPTAPPDSPAVPAFPYVTPKGHKLINHDRANLPEARVKLPTQQPVVSNLAPVNDPATITDTGHHDKDDEMDYASVAGEGSERKALWGGQRMNEKDKSESKHNKPKKNNPEKEQHKPEGKQYNLEEELRVLEEKQYKRMEKIPEAKKRKHAGVRQEDQYHPEEEELKQPEEGKHVSMKDKPEGKQHRLGEGKHGKEQYNTEGNQKNKKLEHRLEAENQLEEEHEPQEVRHELDEENEIEGEHKPMEVERRLDGQQLIPEEEQTKPEREQYTEEQHQPKQTGRGPEEEHKSLSHGAGTFREFSDPSPRSKASSTFEGGGESGGPKNEFDARKISSKEPRGNSRAHRGRSNGPESESDHPKDDFNIVINRTKARYSDYKTSKGRSFGEDGGGSSKGLSHIKGGTAQGLKPNKSLVEAEAISKTSGGLGSEGGSHVRPQKSGNTEYSESTDSPWRQPSANEIVAEEYNGYEGYHDPDSEVSDRAKLEAIQLAMHDKGTEKPRSAGGGASQHTNFRASGEHQRRDSHSRRWYGEEKELQADKSRDAYADSSEIHGQFREENTPTGRPGRGKAEEIPSKAQQGTSKSNKTRGKVSNPMERNTKRTITNNTKKFPIKHSKQGYDTIREEHGNPANDEPAVASTGGYRGVEEHDGGGAGGSKIRTKVEFHETYRPANGVTLAYILFSKIIQDVSYKMKKLESKKTEGPVQEDKNSSGSDASTPKTAASRGSMRPSKGHIDSSAVAFGPPRAPSVHKKGSDEGPSETINKPTNKSQTYFLSQPTIHQYKQPSHGRNKQINEGSGHYADQPNSVTDKLLAEEEEGLNNIIPKSELYEVGDGGDATTTSITTPHQRKPLAKERHKGRTGDRLDTPLTAEEGHHPPREPHAKENIVGDPQPSRKQDSTTIRDGSKNLKAPLTAESMRNW